MIIVKWSDHMWTFTNQKYLISKYIKEGDEAMCLSVSKVIMGVFCTANVTVLIRTSIKGQPDILNVFCKARDPVETLRLYPCKKQLHTFTEIWKN